MFRLPIDDIDQAKLVPDWDAVMKGKRGVGKPGAKPVKPGHRPSQKRHTSLAKPGGQSQREPHPASGAGDGNDAENKEQG
jgi:hypothetical protein